MSSKKKKAKPPEPRPELPPPRIDLDALLMIGDERIVIDREENDNVGFMAELIDSM
ncbi:hypothetical protein SAMN05192549_101539 [Duganella sacchari]|uniref:Uncharacterized protein n=1 Tax=Duganella sacchari TaxID=551987 RepID=A0A1M7IM84_9BURK|nr:hypothetical protein [Duganella sacchari]SHM41713.1 hypothetical protein SAMN05192549_101539 [Duganella sacchari]